MSERTMNTAADALTTALAGLTAEALAQAGVASAEEAGQRIREVEQIASAWVRGELPLSEVRLLTTVRERFLVARSILPMTPDMRCLMDALVRDEGCSLTKHGLVTEEEARESEVRIVREDGRDLLIYPIRYPYRIPPDRKRGFAGVRMDAVYRRDEERHPTREQFHVYRSGEAEATPRRGSVRRIVVDQATGFWHDSAAGDAGEG